MSLVGQGGWKIWVSISFDPAAKMHRLAIQHPWGANGPRWLPLL